MYVYVSVDADVLLWMCCCGCAAAVSPVQGAGIRVDPTKVYTETVGDLSTLEFRMQFFVSDTTGRALAISPWHDIPLFNDDGALLFTCLSLTLYPLWAVLSVCFRALCEGRRQSCLYTSVQLSFRDPLSTYLSCPAHVEVVSNLVRPLRFYVRQAP